METGRRPLKILHLDPEKEWGGGETQVKGLLTYLSLHEHQNHLLCHPDGALFAEARGMGIRVFPIKISNEFDFRPVFALRRLIRKEQYSIVHFHTKRAHAMSMYLGRTLPELRYVVTRRMDYPVKGGWYTHRLYNSRVDGVIAISHKIASLLTAAGVRREKIRVIHSGIDPALYKDGQRGGGRPGSLVVGTVASLEPRKGHRFLLEAAALLKRQGYRLRYRFAGEGTQRASLEQAVLRLGLQKDVAFMGFVSDIPAFLSEVDIFVLPSLYEGLGVAVIEAMAAGKPVVATRVGGIPEVIVDQDTGILVPPGNPVALARSIAQLVSPGCAMERIAKRARDRAKEEFTMERMAKRNEDFYYELLLDR